MLFLILDPLILILSMLLVVKNLDRITYIKLACIGLAAAAIAHSGSYFLGIFFLVLYFIILPVSLVQVCRLSGRTSFVVTMVFLGIKIVVMILLIRLLSH